MRVYLLCFLFLCGCAREEASEAGAGDVSEAADLDWSDWYPDPPPSRYDGPPSRFLVTVVTERATEELYGSATLEMYTSPSGRRAPRYRHDCHHIGYGASHSHSLYADVSIRQDHAEDPESRERFDITVWVTYSEHQGEAFGIDWSGTRSLATRQTISRPGIDVVIEERPN